MTDETIDARMIALRDDVADRFEAVVDALDQERDEPVNNSIVLERLLDQADLPGPTGIECDRCDRREPRRRVLSVRGLDLCPDCVEPEDRVV